MGNLWTHLCYEHRRAAVLINIDVGWFLKSNILFPWLWHSAPSQRRVEFRPLCTFLLELVWAEKSWTPPLIVSCMLRWERKRWLQCKGETGCCCQQCASASTVWWAPTPMSMPVGCISGLVHLFGRPTVRSLTDLGMLCHMIIVEFVCCVLLKVALSCIGDVLAI